MNCVDGASNILGWMSIGCWIIVYTPQLLENYQLKSGEGLSVAFVLVWLAGDFANLLGAVLAHLIPTIIILAVYYTLCDIGLLFQIYYYRHRHPVQIGLAESMEANEATPFLPQLSKSTPDQESVSRKVLRFTASYTLGTLFVLGLGAIAYYIDIKARREGHEGMKDCAPKVFFEWRGQIFGWMSAVLYLSSRVPQILKNLTTKCYGLSPVLFFFAIAGNATYVASILVVSVEWRYLAVNASWLAGSGLTIFLDLIVLAQFIYFRATEQVFVPDDDDMTRLSSSSHERA